METGFDDSRLDDAAVLDDADYLIRPLAESGARLRRAASDVAGPLGRLGPGDTPRAVVAFGPEAHLLRDVLQPSCPVPFVAWPRLDLPGWVGPMDTVVTLGATSRVSLAAAAEAVRRGARLLVACPPDSELARASASRSTTLLPVPEADALSAPVVVLEALHRLGLGPAVDIDAVAQAMDDVSVESSPHLDVAHNPAKDVALELADAQPLVWGGSVLAAQAGSRIADALRRASHRLALSANADVLLPLMRQTRLRDVFADPVEDGLAEYRPGLVIVNDGWDDDVAVDERRRLVTEALSHDVRVSHFECDEGGRVQRYAAVLLKGLFAAGYLEIGLGGQFHVGQEGDG